MYLAGTILATEDRFAIRGTTDVITVNKPRESMKTLTQLQAHAAALEAPNEARHDYNEQGHIIAADFWGNDRQEVNFRRVDLGY